jgi:hypothetical protein
VAHELARALEDEQAAPRRALPFRDDENAALALEEGAASVVERSYATRHLGVEPPVRPTVAEARADEGDPSTPPALSVYESFPAAFGGPFVAALHERGGFERVEDAMRAGPASTRDLLHPGGAGAPDDVVPPRPQVTRALGEGWTKLADGEVGELDVLAMLSAGEQERAAARGAEGLVAATFETWTKGKTAAQSCPPPCRRQSASVVVVRFDGERDALEFDRAARRALGDAAGAEPAGGRAWTVEDGGAALVRGGRFAALAFAPDPPFAGKVAEAAVEG